MTLTGLLNVVVSLDKSAGGQRLKESLHEGLPPVEVDVWVLLLITLMAQQCLRPLQGNFPIGLKTQKGWQVRE
jgi:hypothetical protein